MIDRPIFMVRFQPERHVAVPIRNLRALLKAALRQFGMRAIDVVQEQEKKVAK